MKTFGVLRTQALQKGKNEKSAVCLCIYFTRNKANLFKSTSSQLMFKIISVRYRAGF
jgi:hypothetical protein